MALEVSDSSNSCIKKLSNRVYLKISHVEKSGVQVKMIGLAQPIILTNFSVDVLAIRSNEWLA